MPQKLTDEQVRHVAKLSRLRLGDDEIHHFAEQLSAVLSYMSKLDELDLDDVEPMAHAMDVTNVLRPDEAAVGMDVQKVLANAPDKSEPFFKVPKVLGDTCGA